VEDGDDVAAVDQMTDTLIEATDLYRFYRTGEDEVLALRGVSVAVSKGELVAVTGPSGSGKSTLLSCMAGLDEPSGGVVRLLGQRLSHRPERERAAVRAASIGVMFQAGNLFDHLTVRDNVAMARSLVPRQSRRGPADETRTAELLERLGLAHRGRAYPYELSGGETARAAVAVALANDPPVLLADEPTGELDTASEGRVVALLTGLAARGHGVLVVTHSPSVARAADRVVRLHDGAAVA
jgi:putative ABC transport system ATP-binding protein